MPTALVDARFLNRLFGIKCFQTIGTVLMLVAGSVLLFGIGTKAPRSWDSKTRRNNLWVGFADR
jgi:hypothetical protein